ncbi:peptide deformylase [Candidatus Microgenomates bacterium]|nr:peptide deformylase [Candidatus Microgenomates bacterium]
MSIYKILRAGNPTLRETSKSVPVFDKKVEKLIADMVTTLKVQKDPIGVGLAAPQVGKSIRLFLAKIGSNSVIFINPEITWISKATNDPSSQGSSGQAHKKPSKPKTDNQETEREYLMEGCLSLPHYYGPVERAAEVKVTYETPKKMDNGQWIMVKIEKKYKGLSAQIVQHEVDHLNGILFIDKLLQQKRKLYEQKGKEWLEVEIP